MKEHRENGMKAYPHLSDMLRKVILSTSCKRSITVSKVSILLLLIINSLPGSPASSASRLNDLSGMMTSSLAC